MSKIAIVLADGYEDSEYTVPRDRLRDAGHDLTLIGCEAGATVNGKQGNSSAEIECTAADVNADDFDALLIPGGQSPDKLRIDEGIVAFVRRFYEQDKPIAAICHGPQLLIEAGIVEGCRMTSWPSVRTDLENAGATVLDEPVVEDGVFITSRKPDDLEAFSAALLRRLDDNQPQAATA